MGNRPAIFQEMVLKHAQYVFDMPAGARVEICSEFLVAKHCEPFFRGELKPISASYPVSSSVGEILVANDRLDQL